MEAVTINLTSNLKLQKPTSDEKYNVQTQNTNMDILDSSIKALQDKDATLTKQADFETHTSNKSNPHNVTKEQLGLSNVVNQRQIPAIQTAVTDGGVPVFDGNGYTLKDSGFTVEKSVPADAKFTDTVYTHPGSGIVPDIYKSVSVDSNGHVVGGSNPTTLSGYGITDAEPLGSAASVLIEAKDYADSTYVQSTGYTDNKVAALINGAPSTMDTLKEIANAMEENKTVVETLETAIGNKAAEAEFQAHQSNTTVHVTASEKAKWDSYEGSKADIGDIPNIANNLTTTETGTALDAYQGKILADMIANTGGDKVPRIGIKTGTSVKLMEFSVPSSSRQSVAVSIRGMNSPGTATIWIDFGYGMLLGHSVESSEQYYIPRLQLKRNLTTNNYELWIMDMAGTHVSDDTIIIDGIRMGEYSGELIIVISDGSETDPSNTSVGTKFFAAAYVPQIPSYEYKNVPRIVSGTESVVIPEDWASKYGHLVLSVDYDFSGLNYIATSIIGFAQFKEYITSRVPILLHADGTLLSTVAVKLSVDLIEYEKSLSYSFYPSLTGLTINTVTAHPL